MSINDKLKNLKEYYQTKGGAVQTTYKGEVIKGEDSYAKRLIRQHELFLLMCGSYVAKKWTRFGRVETGDYFYMSETYYDAVCFRPKRAMHFLGFGFLNQYEKNSFKLKFRYQVDSVQSEEVELDITQEMLQEDKMFRIDFQELGIEAVELRAE